MKCPARGCVTTGSAPGIKRHYRVRHKPDATVTQLVQTTVSVKFDNLEQVKQFMIELMRCHGVWDVCQDTNRSAYRFRWNKGVRTMGQCDYDRAELSLSSNIVGLNLENNPWKIVDTMLHEIAHARTPGAGHGLRWRAECERIGARPLACYHPEKDNVKLPLNPYRKQVLF